MDHETVVAYLDRVGVTAPAAGDAAGLRTLHRAHQLTVPFEVTDPPRPPGSGDGDNRGDPADIQTSRPAHERR